MAYSSGKNANRIAALIDSHLGRMNQPEKLIHPNNAELSGFDIGAYVE